MSGRSSRRPQDSIIHAGRYVRPWTVDSLPSNLSRYVESYRATLSLIENVPERLEAIAKDVDLSDTGKASRRRALAQDGAQVIKQARAELSAGLEQIDRLRGEMVRSSIDKTDVAAAMVRGEIRSWLRSLPDGKRTALMAAGTDPEVAAAIIEAPPALSGVTPQRHQQMREEVIRHLNPELSQEVDRISECLASLASAEEAATRALSEGTGVVAGELEEMLGGPSLQDRIRERLRADGHGVGDEPANDGQSDEEAA